jgi:elongation factor Ts
LEDLQNAQLDGVTIKDKLLDTVAKIGEKIEVKKYEVVEGDGCCLHPHGIQNGCFSATKQSIK